MEPEEVAQELYNLSLEFLKTSRGRINANTFIYSKRDIAKLYIRRSRRFVDNQIIIFFDVASIDIKEHMQKKGILSNYLNLIEEKIPYPILLENANNPYLFAHMLKRRNWELREPNSFIYKEGKPWIISTHLYL